MTKLPEGAGSQISHRSSMSSAEDDGDINVAYVTSTFV